MRPPSPQSTFFFSLKQVEKRLKLETPTPSSSNIQKTNPTFTDSLSTPMFIQTCQGGSNTTTSTPLQDSSEPPPAFLSSSSQSPPREFPEQQLDTGVIDDIDLLMQHLGLSDFGRKRVTDDGDDDECCGCESGFYEKIVGVKGPKSKKEVDRLDGWISYFLRGDGEGRTETLRLGYLLLGKAACELEGGDRGLDFPLAIEEFLKNDPPTE
ncbi:hypothetical protein M5689_009108 [Euphorbia peplus]|nr:hypothetical protein M5689_009108 [Euphorbia peplus]